MSDKKMHAVAPLQRHLVAGAFIYSLHCWRLQDSGHVHPSGNFVYISNRTYASNKHQADNAIPYGEDNIAVLKINGHSGKVTPIQHCDTNGSLPRTFSIDPSGQILIAANSENANKATKLGQVKQLPISLNLFIIGLDGRLQQNGNIVFQGNNQSLFWAGFL